MTPRWSVQTRYVALTIALLLIAALIYYARALISPLVIAALLAYVLDPAVAVLTHHWRFNRKYAVILVYVVFLATLVSIPAILTPVIIVQADDIQREMTNIQHGLENFLTQADLWGIPLLPEGGASGVQDLVSLMFDPQRVFGVLLAATANMAWVLIILVTTFFFLLDGERLKNWFFGLISPDYLSDAYRLHEKIKEIWQAYLRGQLLLMFTVGLLTWFMGQMIGLRGALLIGIVAGALDVIPSLGPAVAMMIGVAIAYFEGSSVLMISRFWFTLLVLGMFIGIQAFENVWLRPRVLSQSLRLHPAVVFVSIVGALALAGVVAALVIVPVISTAELVGRYVFRQILGQDPWQEAAATVPHTESGEAVNLESPKTMPATEPGREKG